MYTYECKHTPVHECSWTHTHTRARTQEHHPCQVHAPRRRPHLQGEWRKPRWWVGNPAWLPYHRGGVQRWSAPTLNLRQPPPCETWIRTRNERGERHRERKPPMTSMETAPDWPGTPAGSCVGRKRRALRPQKPWRLIRDGEVGGSGIFISNTYWLCRHHQNDSAWRWAVVWAIFMFHSLCWQSHETVSINRNFWRERRAEADRTEVPLLTSLAPYR